MEEAKKVRLKAYEIATELASYASKGDIPMVSRKVKEARSFLTVNEQFMDDETKSLLEKAIEKATKAVVENG